MTGKKIILPKRIKDWYLNYRKPDILLPEDCFFEEFYYDFCYHYAELNDERPWAEAGIPSKRIRKYVKKYITKNPDYIEYYKYLIRTVDSILRTELRKDQEKKQEEKSERRTHGNIKNTQEQDDGMPNRKRTKNQKMGIE